MKKLSWPMLIILVSLLLCALPFIHYLLTFTLMFPENQEIGSVVVWGIVLGGCAGLGVAIVVVPVAALCVRRQWHRPFLVAALMIAVTTICGSVTKRWRSPPSAARYFHEVFAATLPSGAQGIQAHHVLFDERTEFYFSCTAAACMDLIQQLGMEETLPTPDYPRENFSFLTYPLRGTPDYTAGRIFACSSAAMARLAPWIRCSAIRKARLCMSPDGLVRPRPIRS